MKRPWHQKGATCPTIEEGVLSSTQEDHDILQAPDALRRTCYVRKEHEPFQPSTVQLSPVSFRSCEASQVSKWFGMFSNSELNVLIIFEVTFMGLDQDGGNSFLCFYL